MKVYEIGKPDYYDGYCEVDCTLWVAVEDGISIDALHLVEDGMYIKEIPEYNERTPGIDFIFRFTARPKGG